MQAEFPGAAIKGIMRRAFASVHVPAALEPSGTYRKKLTYSQVLGIYIAFLQ